MHDVLVNRLGGLSLPKKSVVRLTDYHDHGCLPWMLNNNTKRNQRSTSVLEDDSNIKILSIETDRSEQKV